MYWNTPNATHEPWCLFLYGIRTCWPSIVYTCYVWLSFQCVGGVIFKFGSTIKYIGLCDLVPFQWSRLMRKGYQGQTYFGNTCYSEVHKWC